VSSGMTPILALRTDGPRAGRLPRFVPLSISDPVWSLIGFFAHGATPGPSGPPSQLKSGSGRALPCPAPPVTMPTNPAPRKRNGRHIAD